MYKRREREIESMRELIITAAKEIITKEGFDNLSIRKIANKSKWLINNPDKARSIGLQGKNTIETRFNYDNWLRENEEIYLSLINQQKS